MTMLKVIEALVRVVEECLAVIEDEARKNELTAAYEAAMGENDY